MAAVSGLGAKLRELRGSLGLTQDELAFRSGVPQATISTLESGRVSRTSHGNFVKLAGALGTTTRVLYEAAGLIEAEELSTEEAEKEVLDGSEILDAQARIRYVEGRPGVAFQANLARLRRLLTQEDYDHLLLRIYAAWESNSELALDAFELGR